MATYRISGVWKNNNNVITHYAIHKMGENNHTRAEKVTKQNAITLVETPGNLVTTWMWDYAKAIWRIGETVHVVNNSDGKFLRSNIDNKLTDNLNHLIDFDWISQ